VVSIGTRTLSESGTVGAWRREQVELFCISKLINCMLESDEEFICMDFHFATGARDTLRWWSCLLRRLYDACHGVLRALSQASVSSWWVLKPMRLCQPSS